MNLTKEIEDMPLSLQDITNRYGQAVVKLQVNGTAASNITEEREGSGFVIYSGARTLVVTAAHVIGSSDWRQPLNPDWLVEAGKVDRNIKVSYLDPRGALICLTESAAVVFQDDQRDVALLEIKNPSLPQIPYVADIRAIEGKHLEVALLGFCANSPNLDYRQGAGQHRGGNIRVQRSNLPRI